MDTKNTDRTPEEVAATDSEGYLPLRKPKRSHLFDTPETWLPLGMSERLLRQRPGEPVLYQCTGEDAAATARNIISFAQRIQSFINKDPEENGAHDKDKKPKKKSIGFKLTTSQCIVINTTFRSVDDGRGSEKGVPVDTCERYIRVVVEKNRLYDEWLLRERAIDAEMEAEMKRIEQEGPKPKGRPRKPKPEPVEGAPPKRGRGRPRLVREGQDSLI